MAPFVYMRFLFPAGFRAARRGPQCTAACFCESLALRRNLRSRAAVCPPPPGRTNRAATSTACDGDADFGQPHLSWFVRLTNENSYLSWMRNAFISSGVGIGIIVAVTASHNGNPLMENYLLAGKGLLLLGCIAHTYGTGQYIYNLLASRKQALLSVPAAITHTLAAILLYCFWLVLFVIFFEDGFYMMSDDSDK